MTVGKPALACIPWAGAGASPFRAWGPVLAGTASVYGVRLAGRESRQGEPPATVFDDVVAGLVQELTALGAPDVALFGQCCGALLAFEVAKALQLSCDGPAVVHLFVASQLPPRVLADAPVEPDQDPMRYVPEEVRGEPELLDMLLPVIAADTILISNYKYSPIGLVGVPLTVVYGARDELLSRAEVDGWRRETTGPTAFRELADAGHLLSGTAWMNLAEVVRAALK